MAGKTMFCPYTNNVCTECAVYRGRHHYLSFLKRYTESFNRQKGYEKSCVLPLSKEFQALREAVESKSVEYNGAQNEWNIRVKLFDIENESTIICDLNELKKWDWDNPEIWRLIDGRHVINLESLIEILCDKAQKGYEEVELYEAPRFMLLAGG